MTRLLLLLGASLLLSGCARLAYYGQAVRGQLDLLAARRPIGEVIADPSTRPAVRERLELVRRLRVFARERLHLPVDDAYRTYADLHRPYVVWNVVATPPLSLDPITWCFPVVGCVSYRGYYHRDAALAFAARLRRAGDDVYVGGVEAYSTLGWFEDPILNTMLGGASYELAGTLFHELAHRLYYLPGDTDFNEAYATTVQRLGVRLWLRRTGTAALRARYRAGVRAEDRVIEMILHRRGELARVYASSLPVAVKRARKRRVLAALRGDYLRLAARDPAARGMRAWFEHDLNNAKLASVATYRKWVPAFMALFHRDHDRFPAFYAAVRRLGALAPAARRRALRSLAGHA